VPPLDAQPDAALQSDLKIPWNFGW